MLNHRLAESYRLPPKGKDLLLADHSVRESLALCDYGLVSLASRFSHAA